VSAESGARSGAATVATPTSTVRRGLARYLDENGFAAAVRAFTRRDRPWQARAVPFHDLHHVATGYGTDLAGECELSGWELGASRCFGPAYFSILGGCLRGLFVAPRRTWRALGHGRRGRALYDRALAYERLLELSIAELRAHLGVPAEGLADRPPRLRARAPSGPARPTAA
jgi:hypothetical protein